AIATGDTRYMRRVELEREIEDLAARKANHLTTQRGRRNEISTLTRTIPNDEKRLDILTEVAPTLTAWAEQDTKNYTVGDATTEVRKDASDQLLERLRGAYARLHGAGVDEHEHVATIAGVPLQATRLMESDKIILRYGDLPIPPTFINQDQLWPPRPTGGAFDRWKTHSLTDDTEPAENEAKASRAALAGGIMTRIENVIARTPDQLDAAA